MSLSLTSFFSQIYTFYKPYFGRRGAALKRTLLLAGILSLNILNAVVYSFFNASMNALFGVLESPNVTWAAFFGATGVSFGYIALYFAFEFLKSQLVNHLTHSLAKAVNESLLNRWINNKAYYGIKFLPTKAKSVDDEEEAELNPAQIMAYDHAELIDNLSYLVDQFVIVLGRFIVGAIALYSLSMPLTFVAFGMTFAIPGYMALGAFGYALTYNFITQRMGAPLAKAEKALRDAQAAFYRKSHEILTQAESIAFIRGTKYELKSLRETLSKMDTYSSLLNSVRNRVYLITSMHTFVGSFFVPLILAAPNIIARTMPITVFYQVMQYFNDIVMAFTWKNENLPMLTSCKIALSRIKAFESLLDAWKKYSDKQEANEIKSSIEPSNNPIEIQFCNITIVDAEGKPLLNQQEPPQPILQNISFTLEKGRATRIKANSGEGKTTLFRAIGHLWPYLNQGGRIVFPNDAMKVEFIPQEAFVYHKGNTLLETILYPSMDKPTLEEINYIKSLMERMGFKPATINELDTVKDWKKILSGGEKGRISILMAIIKKPDVLFMDEATAALDHDTKARVETVLKEDLPNCAIAYIDHNPSHEREEMHVEVKTFTPLRDNARPANAFHHNTINLSSQSIARSTSGLVI